MPRWGEGRKSCCPGKSRYLGLGGRGGSSEHTSSTQWHCASRCLLTPTNRITMETDRCSRQTHASSGGRQFPKENEMQLPLT